jgi:hypothetical protein
MPTWGYQAGVVGGTSVLTYIVMLGVPPWFVILASILIAATTVYLVD